jgi:plastocyanin
MIRAVCMRRRGLIVVGMAMAALAAPADASALQSRLVSVRTVEPGVQRHVFRYGPLVAAPGQNLTLVGPVTIERPPGAGYVKRYRPDLVGPDGRAPFVEQLHMHHAVFVNMSKQDLAAPHLPQRIGGFGEEKTIATLPDPYGYAVEATDVWALNYMLHNGTPEARTAWIELEVDWVPAGTPKAATLKPAHPLWLDVRNGEGNPVFDAHRGTGGDGKVTYPDEVPDPYAGGPRLNEWTADRDMTLIAAAGHLHPGGLSAELDVVRGGQRARAFRSDARYFDPNGPVSWDMAMTYSPDDWRVAVRRGDTLRVSSTYETERASWYESMGIMLTFYADGASGADPFTQPVATTGEPTHGHLPEAGNHGGAPTGLPDATALPDGATVQDGVGIADFAYMPGDLNGGDLLGLPPVVDPGLSLTFVNFDAAPQIPHTVTACRAPCNRSTGVSYPLADGEVQFDSGQLGYGPQGYSSMAQRTDWRTPTDLDPGTYTYFCRVHPYMRGAFRVRGTPKPKPPPGGGGGGSEAARGPSARIASKRVTADRTGRLRVKLGCPAGGGRCTGRLLLQAVVGGRTRTLGSARYAIAAGGRANVRVRLSRSALKLLKRRRSMRVTAVAKGAGGSVTRSLVLRAPRR